MVQGAICIFFIVKRTGLFYAHTHKKCKNLVIQNLSLVNKISNVIWTEYRLKCN